MKDANCDVQWVPWSTRNSFALFWRGGIWKHLPLAATRNRAGKGMRRVGPKFCNWQALGVMLCSEESEPRQSPLQYGQYMVYLLQKPLLLCAVPGKTKYVSLCKMYTLLGIVWSGFWGSEWALCALAGKTPLLNVCSAPLLLLTTPSRLAFSTSSLQNVQITQFILTGPLWEGWRDG